jgi:hypothetical protein
MMVGRAEDEAPLPATVLLLMLLLLLLGPTAATVVPV